LFVSAEAIDAGLDERELKRLRDAHPIARARIEPLIAPLVSGKTKEALSRAADDQEWAALALSSPEFMYR
jgi:hypothetical protein